MGDGVLYILDSCPVTSSCLDGADSYEDQAETVSWTNDGSEVNPVYVVLDNFELVTMGGFILDLSVQ